MSFCLNSSKSRSFSPVHYEDKYICTTAGCSAVAKLQLPGSNDSVVLS